MLWASPGTHHVKGFKEISAPRGTTSQLPSAGKGVPRPSCQELPFSSRHVAGKRSISSPQSWDLGSRRQCLAVRTTGRTIFWVSDNLKAM